MDHHIVRITRTLIACLLVSLASLVPMSEAANAVSLQQESATIRVTKKQCSGRSVYPVFVESHCVEVPDATFDLRDPRNIHPEMLVSGQPYQPDPWYFAGSNLWSLTDVSPNASAQGVDVVSCLASGFRIEWHSSVPRVVQTGTSGSVLIDWFPASTGVVGRTFQPSLDCIWLELPDLYEMPAVLSLQVYISSSAYLSTTSVAEPSLKGGAQLGSGDDIEAAMIMSNVNTANVYSFAADAYGQVLVPAGTYSLVEAESGSEDYFTMIAGETTLAEVGIAADAAVEPTSQQVADTGTFATGALYCVGQECSALAGVTIFYESMDGSLAGYCVTEPIETPNGWSGWCEYPFIDGVPTVLTLDTTTLPAGTVLTSENPVTYLVPEHPDGPLGPVMFVAGPA